MYINIKLLKVNTHPFWLHANYEWGFFVSYEAVMTEILVNTQSDRIQVIRTVYNVNRDFTKPEIHECFVADCNGFSVPVY